MDFRRIRLWALMTGLALCALAACVPVLLIPSTASAGDEVEWVRDYPAAVAQARSQSKLLLVVDVTDDFLAGTAGSPQAKLYQALATSDPPVAELLAARFVCTFRAVGRPECVQFIPPAAKDAAPASGSVKRSIKTEVALPPLPDEFALAYVCLPSERVLHFVPGFVTAKELLRELEWAEAANRERLQSPPTEKTWFVRARHLAATPPAQLEPFEARYKSKWTDDARTPATQKPHDLSGAIRAARDIRDEALLARLQGNWPAGANRQHFLTSLAAHGGLEPALAHLVLAEFPLPELAAIDRTLFEMASGGGHYWRVSPRRGELLAWWTEKGQAGMHRVVVVADHPIYAEFVKAAEPLRWPPTSPDIKSKLKLFAGQHMTLDELAQLSADADLEPIRFQATDGPPRYLIHDARGFRVAEISAREGTTKRLTQALEAAVISGDLAHSGDLVDSGDKATATRARGGETDEPK